MWAQELWCLGLSAPWHVGSSWAGDPTCVPCIGRQILSHWTTKENLGFFLCLFLYIEYAFEKH